MKNNNELRKDNLYMKYVIMFTTRNHENNRYSVSKEVYEDFEEAMETFTLLSSTRDNVIMIEPDAKKVICHYLTEGVITFNRYLLDSSLYLGNEE